MTYLTFDDLSKLSRFLKNLKLCQGYFKYLELIDP